MVAVRRVTGDGLGRVEMQRHMTEEVLKALLQYLQTLLSNGRNYVGVRKRHRRQSRTVPLPAHQLADEQ
jgi:hypothetical protein